MYGFNCFGKYFEALRTSRNATLNELAEGLCAKCLITKIESGERLAKRSLRIILLGRLGASFEEMTEYVSVSEYNYICKKNSILEKIRHNDNENAVTELNAFHNTYLNDRIADQFYYTCMAMIEKDIASCDRKHFLENAIKQTITYTESGEIINTWLAPCEINILLEYALGFADEPRINLITKLLNYTEKHEMMDRCKVLIYPKLVSYYCQFIPDNYTGILTDVLEKVENALKLLKETKKLYYQLELLEAKTRILIKIIGATTNNNTKNKYLQMLQSTCIALMAIKKLSANMHQNIYMTDWTYIYFEHDVRTPGKDIHDRRMMFGLSREKIYENVCSEKTFSRLENMKNDVHITNLTSIFEKLGFNPTNKQNYIEVYDLETKEMEEGLKRLVFCKQYEEAQRLIHLIRSTNIKLSLWAEQVLSMIASIINYQARLIDKTALVINLRKALQMTMPYKTKNVQYLCMSRNEQLCFYNIVKKANAIDQNDKSMLQTLFNQLRAPIPDAELGMLELYYIAMIKTKISEGTLSDALALCDEAIIMELYWHRSSIICNILSYKNKILLSLNTDESVLQQLNDNLFIWEKIKEQLLS